MEEEPLVYTENTEEIRKKLEMMGYSPLSFFQGKEYIRPMICTWGNIRGTWKTYEYSTFEDPEKLNYPTKYLEKSEFLKVLITLIEN
jgi:hypothetical protein